jgi:hypothetical protein
MISHLGGLLIQIIRHRFEYYRFKLRKSTVYRNKDVSGDINLGMVYTFSLCSQSEGAVDWSTDISTLTVCFRGSFPFVLTVLGLKEFII